MSYSAGDIMRSDRGSRVVLIRDMGKGLWFAMSLEYFVPGHGLVDPRTLTHEGRQCSARELANGEKRLNGHRNEYNRNYQREYRRRRFHSDPEFKARINAANRRYYRKKRKEAAGG